MKGIEGHVRTLLHRMAELFAVEFSVNDAIVTWAVRHAGFLMSNARVLASVLEGYVIPCPEGCPARVYAVVALCFAMAAAGMGLGLCAKAH